MAISWVDLWPSIGGSGSFLCTSRKAGRRHYPRGILRSGRAIHTHRRSGPTTASLRRLNGNSGKPCIANCDNGATVPDVFIKLGSIAEWLDVRPHFRGVGSLSTRKWITRRGNIRGTVLDQCGHSYASRVAKRSDGLHKDSARRRVQGSVDE